MWLPFLEALLSSKRPTAPWLPTPQAALELGCSAKHLKRQRDIAGGFLEAGVHYALGPTCTSPNTWNVEAVRTAFHRRGLAARKEVG